MLEQADVNRDRWRMVERIYHRVQETALVSRNSVLDEECASDPSLRLEVEALLAADERAGSFLAPGALHAELDKLAAEEAVLPPGSTLGRYQILEKIGAGGMGTVYRARDSVLRRLVALKVLAPDFTSRTQGVLRFTREAKAASALNHPNIITIYEIGSAGDTHFIAAELVEGGTLRELLSHQGLGAERAVDIAIQIAAALEATHAAGIIHRDIKPENLMVRPDGVVKVLDFGLARSLFPSEVSDARTAAGAMLGTPRYMSPEQARGQPADARSDLFSLGSVLYEMVAGKPPFRGANTADLFVSLLTRDPDPLQDPADAGFDAVLRKALRKEPQQRYGSAAEFRRDLEQVRDRLRSGTAVRRTLRWRHAPAAALLALLAAGVYFGSRQAAVTPVDPPAAIVPVTTLPGAEDQPALSPDGRRLAFAWAAPGSAHENRSIYIQGIGEPEPRRLTKAAADDSRPAWSPDGRQIAFLRDVNGRGSAFIVPAEGGAEREICEAGAGLSWALDGKHLAITTFHDAEWVTRIAVASLETGAIRMLTSAAKPEFDDSPQWSPDGRTIAFTRNLSYAVRELFVIPAQGGVARQVTFDGRSIFGLTWNAGSREVVFASNRAGGPGLWRVPAAGGAPRRILTGQNATNPSISRSGGRLAYTESITDSNIYRFTGTGFGGRAEPAPFTSATGGFALSTREDHSPQISPRGDLVAFVSNRSGSEEIWLARRDGDAPVQLTHFGGPACGTPRWSPDGKWIAFDSRVAGGAEVYAIDAAGGSPRRITHENTHNALPSWSADGRWIYFASNRGTDRDMWKIPFNGGEVRQVTRTGGREGFESPDGKTFYFTKGRGVYGVWSVPVDGGQEKLVPELAKAGYYRSWGVLRQGIYFISKEPAEQNIVRFFSFATRRITPLAAMPKPPLWAQPALAVAPDGTWMLYAQVDHSATDIMLFDNFR